MNNEFASDAAHNLKRAATLLRSSPFTDEMVEDVTLQFAFGIERFCKAVLYDINPIFYS